MRKLVLSAGIRLSRQPRISRLPPFLISLARASPLRAGASLFIELERKAGLSAVKAV
jgi:hypothetical protein